MSRPPYEHEVCLHHYLSEELLDEPESIHTFWQDFCNTHDLSCRLFKYDLAGIMPHILEPRQLKEEVKRLHAAHCASDPTADVVDHEDSSSGPQDDMERQGDPA